MTRLRIVVRTWDQGEEDVDGDDRGLKATLRVRVEGALTATARAQRLSFPEWLYSMSYTSTMLPHGFSFILAYSRLQQGWNMEQFMLAFLFL